MCNGATIVIIQKLVNNLLGKHLFLQNVIPSIEVYPEKYLLNVTIRYNTIDTDNPILVKQTEPQSFCHGRTFSFLDKKRCHFKFLLLERKMLPILKGLPVLFSVLPPTHPGLFLANAVALGPMPYRDSQHSTLSRLKLF